MMTVVPPAGIIAGPSDDIPVKVSGNVKSGFEAEFEPREAGVHTVLVEYNGIAVGGTPFYSKAYDSRFIHSAMLRVLEL